MHRFIFKRLLMLVPVLLGATFIVFFIMDLSPGDPAQIILGRDATPEQIHLLREDMGLNDHLLVRYFRYIGGLLQGEMGVSFRNNLSVASQIAERLPNTILLAFSGMFIAVLIGIPVGIISAKKQYTVFDYTSMVLAMVGASAPVFWLGLMMVIVFALHLGLFPSSGMGQGFFGVLHSLALPATTLGVSITALVARMTRSSMLEVIRQDYVDTARAKGLKEWFITWRHMMKNALIPIITVVGLQFGALLGGSVMTETIFSWPGVGRFVVEGIQAQDTPVVLGSVVVMAIMFSVVNLLVDILYAYVDPRIKSQYRLAKGARND